MIGLSPRVRQAGGIVVVLVAIGLFLWSQHSSGERGSASAGTDPVSGLRLVAPADLPPQARVTMALIGKGRPFPYARDGIVFRNQEGILPEEASGYYHEYTVPTPGSPDRGARRIIAGRDGALFYTSDHYQTFRRIEGT